MASVIEIPRGPIYRDKSGTVDTGDLYESRLLRWRDSALEQGLAEMRDSPESENVQDYIGLIEGEHWRGLNLASWRSKFTDNRISRARVETIAYLTDIKPTIEVGTKVAMYEKASKVINDVIRKQWVDQRIDQALDEVIDHALFGTGYWKIGCSWPGEFHILACGIDTVIPIQQGKDLQDSVSILYRAWKPPQFFKSRWGARATDIEREADPGMLAVQSNQYSRPWNIQEYSWNSMSPALRYHKARRSPSSSLADQWAEFPLIELQEFWIEDFHVNESDSEVIVKDPYLALEHHNFWYRVKPGHRLYPRKRLVVFGGDRLMYDGPSPYWHGLFPFAKLRTNPIVWSSGGLSIYRDLKPINLSINRIGAGVENVVEKAIKPITITKEGTVANTSWQMFFPDRAGAKLKVNPMSSTADVRFIDPPILPAYVEQQRQYLIASFRDAAGQLDTGALAKKKQLPGGDTIEQFKDSQTAMRRREMRNLEIFLEDAGRIAVPCVAQFFSRDQRFRMLGDDGLTPQDFDFKPGTMYSWAGLPEEFHRNFSISITPGSLHSGSKDREKMTALQLFKMQAIPLRELYRILEINNADQLIAELAKEHQSGAIPPPKGRGKQQAMTRGQKNGKPV